MARASDGSFQIAIVGPDGTGFLDRRFGTSGEFSGFSNLGPDLAAQDYQRGNKEYITFSESEAAATSVTASSDAGTVSATSSATHTASVTFVVDFTTGGISMLRSEIHLGIDSRPDRQARLGILGHGVATGSRALPALLV